MSNPRSDTDSAEDVCEKYDKVAQEIADDDVATAFNGEIFDALDNLAKKVKDFDAEPAIKATGEAMLDMANDDSASIDEVEAMPPIREVVQAEAFNAVLNRMAAFRETHYKWAQEYIDRWTDDPRGTGGTPYMAWLKQLIDETLDFRL